MFTNMAICFIIASFLPNLYLFMDSSHLFAFLLAGLAMVCHQGHRLWTMTIRRLHSLFSHFTFTFTFSQFTFPFKIRDCLHRGPPSCFAFPSFVHFNPLHFDRQLVHFFLTYFASIPSSPFLNVASISFHWIVTTTCSEFLKTFVLLLFGSADIY